MKPVQLTPVVVSSGGVRSQATLIGGVVVGTLAVLGYFGFAVVSDLKAQSAELDQKAQAATETTAQIQTQIDEAGQKSDFTQLAAAAEKTVVDTVNQRIDFVELTTKVSQIPPPGLWFKKMSMTAPDALLTGGAPSQGLTIDGVAPDLETLASLIPRLDGLDVVAESEIQETGTVGTKSGKKMITFKVVAKLVGGTADAGQLAGDGSATLVAGDSASDDAKELALVPEPGYRHKAKKKKVIKPVRQLSPFEKLVRDTNDNAASTGSGS